MAIENKNSDNKKVISEISPSSVKEVKKIKVIVDEKEILK